MIYSRRCCTIWDLGHGSASAESQERRAVLCQQCCVTLAVHERQSALLVLATALSPVYRRKEVQASRRARARKSLEGLHSELLTPLLRPLQKLACSAIFLWQLPGSLHLECVIFDEELRWRQLPSLRFHRVRNLCWERRLSSIACGDQLSSRVQSKAAWSGYSLSAWARLTFTSVPEAVLRKPLTIRPCLEPVYSLACQIQHSLLMTASLARL